MGVKFGIAATLVLIQFLQFVIATPGPGLYISNICDRGIYAELGPVLSEYPIAQAICSALYPVECTETASHQKREPASTTSLSMTTHSSTVETTPIPSRSTTQDRNVSAWSRFRTQPANVASAICSCIETAKVSLFRSPYEWCHCFSRQLANNLHSLARPQQSVSQ